MARLRSAAEPPPDEPAPDGPGRIVPIADICARHGNRKDLEGAGGAEEGWLRYALGAFRKSRGPRRRG